MLKKILTLMLASFLATAATAELESETIPQSTLLSYLAGKENFVLIDARSEAEYEAGHIWGALNVPHDTELNVTEVLPEDPATAVVLYCKSGKRAALLKQSMLAKGYSNVKVLPPEQMLWADDNLPVFNCGATESSPATLTSVN